MSISAKNITKFYGAQAALRDVSFSVERGEIVGFLGPNGAGKSTMMKIITCYLPASEGEVLVAGHDVHKQSIQVRQKVGYLPENNPLYLEMYIREYLRFVAGMYGLKNKKARVEEMIELVGLQVESHKQIGELSKGYRQRVGLAQALIHDPEVLILDEPTSGLDPNQLDDIRALIRRIGKEKTVLLSTHIMQEVEAICDRVIIIKRGELVADSSVAGLKAETEVETFYLHVSGSLDVRELRKLEGVSRVELIAEGKFRIHGHKGKSLGGTISRFTASRNLVVEEMKKEERRLEDIFKTLTT